MVASMIKRTYAKRAIQPTVIHEVRSAKRRRVDANEQHAPSSSPTRTSAIFSDENIPNDWTPPSSPNLPMINVGINKIGDGSKDNLHVTLHAPSAYREEAAKKILKTPSWLEKSTRTNLAPLQPKCQLERTQSKKKTKKPLTQMRLDLGQQITKRCQTCGMEYRPSVADDKKLHGSFHSRNVDGISVNNLGTLLRTMEDEEGLYREDVIVSLGRDRQLSVATKKLVRMVLEVVETELGGVGIGAEELWSQVREPRAENSSREAILHDRYKTFLFLRKDKILGVCLAERIFEARRVLPNSSKQTTSPARTTTDAAIMTEEATQPATLGISRIWVSKCGRGQGIADKLLQFAAKRFIYRVEVPRQQIAFSQPTMSGARLARRFFDRESGWLVYAG